MDQNAIYEKAVALAEANTEESLEEAMSHIKDGAAVISGGFGSLGSPEELYSGLARRFEQEGHPRGLTFVCGITPGDKTEVQPGGGAVHRRGV